MCYCRNFKLYPHFPHVLSERDREDRGRATEETTRFRPPESVICRRDVWNYKIHLWNTSRRVFLCTRKHRRQQDVGVSLVGPGQSWENVRQGQALCPLPPAVNVVRALTLVTSEQRAPEPPAPLQKELEIHLCAPLLPLIIF